MRVKVIEKNYLEEFEEEVNEFIKDKKIIDIGYSTGEFVKEKKTIEPGYLTGEPRSNGGVGWWSALILYKEGKSKGKVSKKKSKTT